MAAIEELSPVFPEHIRPRPELTQLMGGLAAGQQNALELVVDERVDVQALKARLDAIDFRSRLLKASAEKLRQWEVTRLAAEEGLDEAVVVELASILSRLEEKRKMRASFIGNLIPMNPEPVDGQFPDNQRRRNFIKALKLAALLRQDEEYPTYLPEVFLGAGSRGFNLTINQAPIPEGVRRLIGDDLSDELDQIV